MSKQLFLQGAPVVLQWCYCRGVAWLWPGTGAVELFCRLSSIVGVGLFCSSSGVGLSAAVAGWGCFAAAICRNAADTGNDYNYRLEEMEPCPGLSVQFFFVLLRHVMLLCPRDIN